MYQQYEVYPIWPNYIDGYNFNLNSKKISFNYHEF